MYAQTAAGLLHAYDQHGTALQRARWECRSAGPIGAWARHDWVCVTDKPCEFALPVVQGLVCNYVIARNPPNLPTSERAIPVAIFRCLPTMATHSTCTSLRCCSWAGICWRWSLFHDHRQPNAWSLPPSCACVRPSTPAACPVEPCPWPLAPAAPSHLWHAPTCVGGAATSGRVRHAELGRALGQGCHDAKDCAARWNPAGAQRVASASPMLTVFVAPPASRTSLSSHFFVAKPPMVPTATQSVTMPPLVACPAPQPARTRCLTCGK